LKAERQRKFSLTGSTISLSCNLPSLLLSNISTILTRVSVYSISLSSSMLSFLASRSRSLRNSSASIYPLPSVSYSRQICKEKKRKNKQENGLSKRKRRRKLSSRGNSWANCDGKRTEATENMKPYLADFDLAILIVVVRFHEALLELLQHRL
ncbi:unnamed protein product, partial [Ixodes persulcatus]